jgi:hypothetical protein
LNATSSTGTGDVLLTPSTTGYVRVSEDILTDSKIAAATGFPLNVGSSIDFSNSAPDGRFTINADQVELHYNNLITSSSTQQMFQNILTDEAYFRQTFTDIVNATTKTTTLRNDLTSQSLTMDNATTTENSLLSVQRLFISDTTNNKSININNSNGLGATENRIDLFKNSGGGITNSSGFSNTTSTQQLFLNSTDNAVGKNVSVYNNTSGNGGITYDNTQDTNPFIISSTNTDLTLSAVAVGSSCNINATALNFNSVNILPRSSYNSLAFSVSGSPPTTNILNFGVLADMTATTTWKVEVGFYTGAINNRNVITYMVYDTTSTDRVSSSVFGYADGGLQTAIQYDPAGTPMGTYCSFVDTFQVNPSAVGDCSFILTGGTSDGSTWSGTCRVSIVLTRIS